MKRIVVRGAINTNKNVNRKHFTQMTFDEVDYLTNMLNSLDHLDFTDYSYDRLEKFGMSEGYFMDMIHEFVHSMVIEYNTGKYGKDKRVLVRDTRIVYSDEGEPLNVCFVVSIPKSTIITIYVNDANDHHDTINFNYYNEDLKIM